MTPAARVQAAIELLDAVIAAAQADGAPADRLVSDYFRTRRYAGSKDRRAVRELVYRAIRACGPLPASGRAAMLRLVADEPALASLFDGSTHGPAPIARIDTPTTLAAPAHTPIRTESRPDASINKTADTPNCGLKTIAPHATPAQNQACRRNAR